MLNGRVAVFLSCSEGYKKRVAYPIRDALAAHDIHGVVVSDEPLLRGASGDPESKVDTYLEASDAFIALCTPDNPLAGGTDRHRGGPGSPGGAGGCEWPRGGPPSVWPPALSLDFVGAGTAE